MDIFGALQGVNAASQVISGYLAEDERQKEKERKEKVRKKIEEQINSGDYVVGFTSEGNIKLTEISPAERIKTQEAQLKLERWKRLAHKKQTVGLTEAEEFEFSGYKPPAPNQWSLFANQIPGLTPAPRSIIGQGTQLPTGLPNVNQYPEGSIVKDSTGKPVAKKVNGQWQPIR